jgi:hypothetical protein
MALNEYDPLRTPERPTEDALPESLFVIVKPSAGEPWVVKVNVEALPVPVKETTVLGILDSPSVSSALAAGLKPIMTNRAGAKKRILMGIFP